jgi:hypothetical protein
VRAIEFQVLGPMRGRCGSSALAMGSPQQQAMLATLLLRPGRSAGTDELIEALWGDRSPSRAKSILRTYAWRWRKALCGQSAADGTEVLVSVAGGYLVNLPEEAVDAAQAELLAARAEQAHAAERLHEAADLLRQAVALWQGEPLAGVPGPFAERQRRRYSELRLSLVEQSATSPAASPPAPRPAKSLDPDHTPGYLPFGHVSERCWGRHMVMPLAELLLDRLRMDGLTVDPDQRRARVPLLGLLGVEEVRVVRNGRRT